MYRHFLQIEQRRGAGYFICKAILYLYKYNKNTRNVITCISLSWNDINHLRGTTIQHNIKTCEGTKKFSTNISFKNEALISGQTKHDFVNFRRPNTSKTMPMYSCGTSYSALV
jgi:hypothetical protein